MGLHWSHAYLGTEHCGQGHEIDGLVLWGPVQVSGAEGGNSSTQTSWTNQGGRTIDPKAHQEQGSTVCPDQAKVKEDLWDNVLVWVLQEADTKMGLNVQRLTRETLMGGNRRRARKAWRATRP